MSAHRDAFVFVESGGYTVKVWPNRAAPIAMAGSLSGDGTWWPMGLAFASDDQDAAIAAAVADARSSRR